MAIFIIRVQITHETNPNYTFLRDGLLNLGVGFTKRITDKDGVQWRLPNGNYAIDTNSTVEAVFKAVLNVALKTDQNPMIVVVKAEPKGMMWSGLQRC